MPRVYNWALYQAELADMYLLHNMQLKDIMTEMFTRYDFNPRQVKYYIFYYLILVFTLIKLIANSERTYRSKFAKWGFTKKQESLHKDSTLVNKVRELWKRNVSSANMLRCLQLDRWHLSTTQLENLRLHPDLRLLMGTAHTPEARLQAAVNAEGYIHEHLVSGQAT